MDHPASSFLVRKAVQLGLSFSLHLPLVGLIERPFKAVIGILNQLGLHFSIDFAYLRK